MLKAEAMAQKQQQVKMEATRRIESKWDKVGQANVALGLYSDELANNCRQWINSHILVVEELNNKEDLLDIDIYNYSGWPTE